MVEWVKEVARREIGDEDKPEVKAHVVYLVKCTKKTDDPAVAIRATPGLWSVYVAKSDDYYTALIGLVVRHRNCVYKEVTGDGGCLYEVTLEYSTDSRDPKDKDPNPLNRPIKVALSFDSFEETAYIAPDKPEIYDANAKRLQAAEGAWKWGKAVVNSAGRPFDPSVTVLTRDPVITVIKNMDTLSWDTMQQYIDSVNTDEFTIKYRNNSLKIGKGCGWLAELTSEPQYENKVAFEAVTVTLKVRKDGWGRKILDAGLEGYFGDDVDPKKPPTPIHDKNGDPVQSPACLDGRGTAIGSQGSTSSVPVFLQWQFKKKQAFSSLPFWS